MRRKKIHASDLKIAGGKIMGMDFGELIEKIVHESDKQSDENFVIYRDNDGYWHCDFIKNNINGLVCDITKAKKQDPFALVYAGRDFANGSYPCIYDVVLCNRLRAEFNEHINQISKTSDEYIKLHEFIDFLEDNISSFSSTSADYLILLTHPFIVLKELFNSYTDINGSEWLENPGTIEDVIKRIEKFLYFHMQRKSLAHVG